MTSQGSNFDSQKVCRQLVDQIARLAIGKSIKIMEVCGTHTMAIFRHGIKGLLPPEVEMVSGPGCPVCVTTLEDVDYAVGLAETEGVILATFGDMMRVPGSKSSLEAVRSRGGEVMAVYTPETCLEIARKQPDRQVVFLGIGFETTTPTVAATILLAEALGINNFSVFSRSKTIPAALLYLAGYPKLNLNGFLCPGHVSVVIGAAAYKPVVEQAGIPAVIAGFDPQDILLALLQLIKQVVSNEARVDNQYRRVVSELGNQKAQEMVARVFETADADWRGIGVIPLSGLRFRDAYQRFNAENRFKIKVERVPDSTGCRCGEVLLGKIKPTQCALFGKACDLQNPLGACMVSSEGTCAAYLRYAARGVK